MSKTSVKWGEVCRYFNQHPDYEIYYQGGDAIILKKPSGEGQRGKTVVRIGHKFLNRTKELTHAHLNKIKRTFGISPEDILR